jgi:hypothetical protein
MMKVYDRMGTKFVAEPQQHGRMKVGMRTRGDEWLCGCMISDWKEYQHECLDAGLYWNKMVGEDEGQRRLREWRDLSSFDKEEWMVEMAKKYDKKLRTNWIRKARIDGTIRLLDMPTINKMVGKLYKDKYDSGVVNEPDVMLLNGDILYRISFTTDEGQVYAIRNVGGDILGCDISTENK